MSSSVALPPFFLKQGISLSPELPLSAVSAFEPTPRTLLSVSSVHKAFYMDSRD